MINRDDLFRISESLLERHGMDLFQAAELANALSSAELRALNEEQVLCHEGDQGDTMWILLKGKIRVFKRDYQGRERKLATLLPPTLIGHMSMVDGTRRSATCRAATDVILATVDKGRFTTLMRDPRAQGDIFRRLMVSSLWQQLSRGNAKLRDLMSPNAREEPTTEQTGVALVDTVATFEGWR